MNGKRQGTRTKEKKTVAPVRYEYVCFVNTTGLNMFHTATFCGPGTLFCALIIASSRDDDAHTHKHTHTHTHTQSEFDKESEGMMSGMLNMLGNNYRTTIFPMVITQLPDIHKHFDNMSYLVIYVSHLK